VSRLRPSPALRMIRLEEKADERELREGVRSPVEQAWERALALASAEEVEELELLCERSQTQEPESLALLETLLRVWELKERMMHRESPTLAALFYRTRRCMFLRGLQHLREQAKLDYEEWYKSPAPRPSPGTSGEEAAAQMHAEIRRRERRYYGVSTAAINRDRALREGLEPIVDLVEASRLVAEVLDAADAPDGTDRVLRLVEWGQ
jgi:hypothetical protein